MRRLLASTVLFFTACIKLCSQIPETDAKVDAFIESQMKREHIPGLALGVYLEGKAVRTNGYGIANVEWNVPVQSDTVFQSGSVGKQFVAVGVMMLVEEGKVSLDDSLQKYFPDAPETWKGITVRNLLSHTSGLAEYESDERTKPGGPFDLRLDFSEVQLYKNIAAMPLDFKPCGKWSYRNTNYVLLGMIIRRVTGEFYGDFLQSRMFKPLGMTSTRIISEEDIVPHRAAGYRLVDGALKNQEWVSPTFNSTADGTLYFTVLDLNKWDAALYTEKLVRKSTLEQLWTPVTCSSGKTYPYGFGWWVQESNGHRLLEHGGAWQGFSAYISRYVDDRLTVAVLTNLDADHSDARRIAHGVAMLYLPDLRMKPITDTEPQVSALLRTTLTELADGKVNLDSFALDARTDWIPERILGLSERLRSFGPARSLSLLESQNEEDLHHYKYRVEFADGPMLIDLYLNRDKKITALQVRSE
ncbi:MAG: serine hydrolase domain-containing protein [Candidatus Acidiferrum sp.]